MGVGLLEGVCKRGSFAILIAVILGAAWAQDPRGTIQGRVLDSSGAIVPGVAVNATNTATNVSVSGVTNETGDYRLPYLLPGIYRIEAEARGFKRHVRDGIEVRVADQLTLDLRLEVGEVIEQVVVTGETPLLEASTASVGQLIDRRRIAEIPVAGGNVLTLSRFAPGITHLNAANHASLANAADVVSRISVNGTGTNNSEFMIDGIPSMEGRNNAYIPPADLVQEIRIETTTYDARAGHSPGGHINVSIRSGTNDVHGSLHHFHTNRNLRGMSLFQRRQLYDPATGPVTRDKILRISPPQTNNRYGGTISGPVVLPGLYRGRNRTFFTYGYEGMIQVSASGGSFRTVPTLAQRRGDFSDLLAQGTRYQIFDPATIAPAGSGRFSRQPFPGNIIPASRLDGVAGNLLSYWPEPNSPGTADGRSNYFRRDPTRTEYGSHLGRVDHNFSPQHRVFVRYHQIDADILTGQTFPNISTGLNRLRGNKGFAFDDVYVFDSSLIMNFRYGLSLYYFRERPFSMGFDLVGAGFSRELVSQLDPQAIVFPNIQVAGLQALGGPFHFANLPNYHNSSLDFTKIRGAHSLRFGGEFRLLRESAFRFQNQTPQLVFGTTWTNGPLDNSPAAPIGQGMASFLLGIPSGGQITINPTYAEQSTYSALYLQDDWKITSRLTLNLGIRYEYEGPVSERFNRSVREFDFTSPNPIEAQVRANYAARPIPEVPASQFRVLGGLKFAGVGGQPRSLWGAEKNNIAPRFGLAYRVLRSTVIRAGYGIFFVPLGADRTNVNQSGFTQRTDVVASLDNGQSFIASLRNPLPNGFQSPIGAGGGLSTDVGRAVSFFNPSPRNGYMQRWSFGVQHELPKRVLFEVGYLGNRGTRLPVTMPLNPVPRQYLSSLPVRDQTTINLLSAQVPNPFFPLLPGTGLAGNNVQRAQLLRPYPHFTGITEEQPAGYSWYHSMQTRAERRFANGFTLNGTYTWSKFMDATGFLNESDLRPEEVISEEDRPHRFALTGVWELPFGPGKPLASEMRGLVRHMVSGWQLQGTYEGQSGAPISFGNVIFRGNLREVPLPAGQRTLERWFNTDAGFERDSRNQLAFNLRTFPSRLAGVEAHGVNHWNLSALKNFEIREGVRLQLRSEWLNALNHTFLAAPVTDPANSLFGQVTAISGQPRTIYFGLKLLF